MMNASRASQGKFGATETMKTQKALLTHQILEKQGSKMDETQTTGIFQAQAPGLLNEVGPSTDDLTNKTAGDAAAANLESHATLNNRSESRSNQQ